MKNAESLTLAFANVQGTRGCVRGGAETLAQITAASDAVGLLELLLCLPRRGKCLPLPRSDLLAYIVRPAQQASRFLAGRSRAYFFPTNVSSAASPPRPKWSKVAARIGASPQDIRLAAYGCGLVTRCRLLPLFGRQSLPRTQSRPLCGYLGTGSIRHSPLLYLGDQNSEIRPAVFFRTPLGNMSLLVCLTHLATLLHDQSPRGSRVLRAAARRIRTFQCQELARIVRKLNQYRVPGYRECHMVIMGDFNCEPSATELEPLRRLGLQCIYDQLHEEHPVTSTTDGRCLDHAWVSAGLTLQATSTRRIGASDHRGVIFRVGVHAP